MKLSINIFLYFLIIISVLIKKIMHFQHFKIKFTIISDPIKELKIQCTDLLKTSISIKQINRKQTNVEKQR